MGRDAAAALTVGSDFVGRYRIEAEIGQGGIGVVYRAFDQKLDRAVALKLLRSEAVGPSQRPRFEREAKALAALTHPNIVAILDCGVSEAAPYLVMELLEGQSLAQALQTRPLPLARAERVIRELISALAYVHARGLVHRDLKPGNVFLQRHSNGGEQVKLLDFGLAKFLDAGQSDATTLTRSGEVFGTPAYMPPEQWSGQAVDARADVYSAAVVCFELLAGAKPFAGGGQELLRRQLVEPAPLLHEVDPDRVASPELERLLQRALARQVNDRQRNATELASELEALPQPWLYSGREATQQRRDAARAVRDALDIAIAPTLEQRVPMPAPPGAIDRAVRAAGELLRRALLLGAWTLTTLSVFAIGATATVIYILRSPGHVEQRAALEQALPPLRDAVMRGAAAAKTAVHDAVSNAADRSATGAQPHEPTPQADPAQPSAARTAPRADREHPEDARGHLLRARVFARRNAWNDALTQYQLAFANDPSARDDPRMLEDLLRAVGREASSARASELVRVIYGRDALGAIASARARAHSADERTRLDRLAHALSP